MSHKRREPLQVSDVFHEKLKELQRKIRMATGGDRSLRDLTEDIAKSPIFEDLERKLIKQDAQFDLRIRMDRRIL